MTTKVHYKERDFLACEITRSEKRLTNKRVKLQARMDSYNSFIIFDMAKEDNYANHLHCIHRSVHIQL